MGWFGVFLNPLFLETPTHMKIPPAIQPAEEKIPEKLRQSSLDLPGNPLRKKKLNPLIFFETPWGDWYFLHQRASLTKKNKTVSPQKIVPNTSLANW